MDERHKNDHEVISRLRAQIDELTRTVQSLRLENQQLREVKRLDDDKILKADLQERETAKRLQ